MQEVYRYDFETKQCILRELEEESNASLEDYEDPPAAEEEEEASDNNDLREETQQVNQHIRLTPIAPIRPLPPVTATNTTPDNSNPDRLPEGGPPDAEPPRDGEPIARPAHATIGGPTIMGNLVTIQRIVAGLDLSRPGVECLACFQIAFSCSCKSVRQISSMVV